MDGPMANDSALGATTTEVVTGRYINHTSAPEMSSTSTTKTAAATAVDTYKWLNHSDRIRWREKGGKTSPRWLLYISTSSHQ